MKSLISPLGKAFLISGLVPALLFAAANFPFYCKGNGQNWNEVAEIVLAGAFLGACLLLLLNEQIVKLYEGSLPLEKKLFAGFLRRNRERHDRLFRRLLALKKEYDKTGEGVIRNSLAHEIEEEWKTICRQAGSNCLPLDCSRVLPTRLGNLFAQIEEYASLRYGMDSVLYWPRLIPVIPPAYAGLIADEKINFNFLINTSVVCVFYAIENVFLAKEQPFLHLALFIVAFFLSYVFYRLSLDNLSVMGEMVNSCFDLFRRDLLVKMNLPVPVDLEQERKLWFKLANYLVSGETFYFPSIKRLRP